MGLTTTVYFGNINNLSDARLAAGIMTDVVSFPVATGSDSLSKKDFDEILRWINGPKVAIEVNRNNEPHLIQICDNFVPDYSHLHRSVDQPHPLPNIAPPIILEVPIQSTEDFDKLMVFKPTLKKLQALILVLGDIALATDAKMTTLSQHTTILASGGFSKEQFLTLSNIPAIQGLYLRGSNEEKPGFRDFGMLLDLLDALDND